MCLGDAMAACVVTDRNDGLVPTVVADESGRTVGVRTPGYDITLQVTEGPRLALHALPHSAVGLQ